MINRLFRIFWRIAIFSVGAIGLWFVLFRMLPYADAHLPLYLALLLCYSLVSYFFVPSLIRLFRIFIKPNHIPLYVTTGDGWPSDPVNIAIVAKNKKQLVRAMELADWYVAEPMTLRNGFRELISIVFSRAYPEAPLSRLYLFNKAQDIGFEKPNNRAKSARTRHHVRFWQLKEPVKNGNHPHTTFWYQKLGSLFGKTNTVWVGAATEEVIPIDIQWRTGRLTHGGSHDADRERDFIIQNLKDAHLVARVSVSEPGENVSFRGQQFRTIYVTDGSLRIVELAKRF